MMESPDPTIMLARYRANADTVDARYLAIFNNMPADDRLELVMHMVENLGQLVGALAALDAARKGG